MSNSVQSTVLIVDDVPDNVAVLVECLRREDYRVLIAQGGEEAVRKATEQQPDLILLDIMLPGIDGFETCRRLKVGEATQDIPVIFLTALDDTADKVRGFARGAVDYLVKPFQFEEVLARVHTHLELRRCQQELQDAKSSLEERVRERTADLHRALEEVERLRERLEAENAYLQAELNEGHRDIVGSSQVLQALLAKVDRVAPTDTTVLISGETGSGKELFARAIYQRSRRRDHALVMLNCAAISSGLVESELFGHIKGAFTGAHDKHVGRFQLADGGTLFLDEVSELPLETQVKLLRVLQEQEFEPVGSATTQQVNVRVIAATNRKLEDEVAAGRFRADLYYRLSVFPIEVPPLRDRRDDIPQLVEHFVSRLSRKLGRPINALAPDVMCTLQAHHWPGNVRELQNTIERAIVMSFDGMLRIDWPLLGPAPGAEAAGVPQPGLVVAPALGPASRGANPVRLEDVERAHFIDVLRRTRGVIEGPRGAAHMLDLKPSTARHRMRKLGIERRDYLDD